MAQADINKKKKAEEIINSVLNKESINESPITKDPEIFSVRVLRLARNPSFVYASLDGTLIDVFHPRNREHSIGRVIKVEKADDLGENRYKVVREFI
jgi:hypothetical protein